ncbi:hypothetical protein GA0061103_4388 [Rhizobium multihospitium]|uniref:Uncharacterized protein n=2 Tax=Rhizobium multihospitium TaxID=410764 RepID=A0A1C3VWJ4_9HYPH|nr:hypothetical protein GA0061103_4388 [Rhizobium multihospitium]
MQVYFAFKDEMRRLRELLEQERQASGATIAEFYDARRNAQFAMEITRFVECRKQMEYRLIEAEKIIEDPNADSDVLTNTNSETTYIS